MLRNGRRARIAIAALWIATIGATAAAQTPTGPGDRIGWTQTATAEELPRLSWAVFIDGARAPLAGVSCRAATEPNSFNCQANFPALTPGTHAIELIAIQTEGSNTYESARSAPLAVRFFVVASPRDLRVERGELEPLS